MGTTAVTVIAVLVAVAALVALVVELVRTPGPVGGRTLVRPVAALAAASFVGAVVVAIGSRPRWLFPVAHLAYLIATIALPAAGLVLLVAAILRRGRVAVAVLGLVLVPTAPIGLYASHVAPYRLRVDHVTVALPAARAGRDAIRIGVLTDLQTTRITSYERGVVDRLLAAHPDVILVGGDLFDGTEAQLAPEVPAFRRLLGRLRAPGGVFAVRGDVDTGDRLDRVTAGTGIRILDNEIVTLHVGDRTVRLGGSPLRWAPDEGIEMRRRLAASPPADVRILLAHRPEIVRGLAPTDQVDLTVAGHTHGGQVAIPGVGPVMPVYALPRSVAAGGLHELVGHQLYVSTGVGMVRGAAPQIRLFTRPSIAVITLR
jgi:hypothetical protein